MSSIDRPLHGDVLVHHLPRAERSIDPELVARSGRSARTLVKEGPLRLIIIGLAAGGDMPPHSTDGPISIQVTDGEVTFRALGNEYRLHTGDILVFAANVEHSATSATGCIFLLTVVHHESAGSPLPF